MTEKMKKREISVAGINCWLLIAMKYEFVHVPVCANKNEKKNTENTEQTKVTSSPFITFTIRMRAKTHTHSHTHLLSVEIIRNNSNDRFCSFLRKAINGKFENKINVLHTEMWFILNYIMC